MLLVRNSNQAPSVFNRYFDGEMFDWNNRHFSKTNTTLPSVNIKENAESFAVELAAPGFEKADFKIELNRNLLTISSDKKLETETNEGEVFTKREFSY
nr:Hsp20/alpha crystallin family protein [Paludibacter sp.]